MPYLLKASDGRYVGRKNCYVKTRAAAKRFATFKAAGASCRIRRLKCSIVSVASGGTKKKRKTKKRKSRSSKFGF